MIKESIAALRPLIALAFAKALRNAGPSLPEHAEGFRRVQKRLADLDPARIRAVQVFVAVEEADGVDILAIAEGPGEVLELTQLAGELQLMELEAQRQEQEACDCPVCQLRRGLRQRFADGGEVNVQVIDLGEVGSIQDIIEEVTRQRPQPGTH